MRFVRNLALILKHSNYCRPFSFRPDEGERTTRTEVAGRILKVVAQGERNPDRPRMQAMTGVGASLFDIGAKYRLARGRGLCPLSEPKIGVPI